MADPQAERIRDLEQRMAAMPGSRIFVGLAEEYRRAGRLGDALATLRSGLESHPTYLSARIAIARLFQEMGRDDEAIDAFGRVLAADRENLVAAKALGDLYSRRGNAVEAIKKFKLYRALSGDRAVDGKIAALEKDARPEAPVAVAPPPPKAPEARMFDPINFSDSSAEFRFDPNSTISLSTLEFSPAEAVPPPPSGASAEAAPAVPTPSSEVSPPAEDVTRPDALPPAEPGAAVESTQAIPVFGSGVGEPEAAVDAEPAARETAPAADAEAATDAPPELPPSRTLAELYERQGFRDEARRIYERLAADHPDDESLTRRIAVVREASPSGAGDGRIRRVRALESWLARVHANAASGTRRA